MVRERTLAQFPRRVHRSDQAQTDLAAHLMMLVPDRSDLEGVSTDHLNGGPWVMWPETPYAHLMIPVDSR